MFTGRICAKHPLLVLQLLRGDFSHRRGDTLHWSGSLRRTKLYFDRYMGTVLRPQNVKVLHPDNVFAFGDFLTKFLEVYRCSHARRHSQYGRFTQVTKISQKTLGGAFPLQFSMPLAAKLLIGSEKVRWVQKWYRILLPAC